MNLSLLLLTRASHDPEIDEIASLAKSLDERRRGEIEERLADVAEDAGLVERARQIRTSLAFRPTAPTLSRLQAAVEVGRAYWQAVNLKEALSIERLSEQLVRMLPKTQSSEGQVALAALRATKVSWKRANLRTNKIKSNSNRALINSFKQKATDLANLEKS